MKGPDPEQCRSLLKEHIVEALKTMCRKYQTYLPGGKATIVIELEARDEAPGCGGKIKSITFKGE